jgi:hypothetical protein
MDILYRLLFGLLGYVILILPHIFGFFIYPQLLTLACGIVSGMWFGPWLYSRYIAYKLKSNNPLKKR